MRAAWSIQQKSRNWHGIGIADFLEAGARREQRYAGLHDLHRTEEVRLYDEFAGGYLSLSADVTWWREPEVRYLSISLRLDGDPVR